MRKKLILKYFCKGDFQEFLKREMRPVKEEIDSRKQDSEMIKPAHVMPNFTQLSEKIESLQSLQMPQHHYTYEQKYYQQNNQSPPQNQNQVKILSPRNKSIQS